MRNTQSAAAAAARRRSVFPNNGRIPAMYSIWSNRNPGKNGRVGGSAAGGGRVRPVPARTPEKRPPFRRATRPFLERSTRVNAFLSPRALAKLAALLAAAAGGWLFWTWVVCRVEVPPGHFLVKIHL